VRVEAPPGGEAQVDRGYAGRALDPVTGELRRAWVFITTERLRLKPRSIIPRFHDRDSAG